MTYMSHVNGDLEFAGESKYFCSSTCASFPRLNLQQRGLAHTLLIMDFVSLQGINRYWNAAPCPV
jgi:hypothetical protein